MDRRHRHNKISARRASFEALEPKRLLAGFNITLSIDTESEIGASENVIRAAAARWERILTADIPNVGGGPWGSPVDDIRIDADAITIDGPGGTLGYADSHYRRPGSQLPINGLLYLDTADLNNPGLLDIATHEIGHLLGIGSLWSTFGLASGTGGGDPTYSGVAARAEYRAYAGNPALASIPVENTGNPGTRDVHWRESTFGRELMTGYYNSGLSNPLSRVSIASLIDMGYPGVDLNAADAYNLPGGSNQIPVVASLSVSPSVSPPGTSLALTADSVADLGGGISSVRYYRETNGLAGLQNAGNVSIMDALVSTVATGPTYAGTISLSGLPVGTYTYYAQVTDTFGAVSQVVVATHTILPPPATPASPMLAAASDSGFSNTDRITNAALPTILGMTASPAGTTIRVFADGTEIGQTSTDASGAWGFTPASPFADGERTITVVAQNAAGPSDASAPLVLTIDTAAPTVMASSFVYLTALGATYTFSEGVASSLTAGNVTFYNATTGTSYPATLSYDAFGTARFGFVSAPPKGDYVATLSVNGINDIAGNALAAAPSIAFFHLPGDINRDRVVNFDDLLLLAQNYGLAANAAQGDLSYNGVADFDDLLILAQNYGASLLTAPPAATKPPAKRTSVAASVLR